MQFFKRARIAYLLRRHAITHSLWAETTGQLAVLHGMTAVEQAHLRELVTLFLHEKQFVGVQGLALTDAMCLGIAVQACLPALGFGLTSLSGWIEIIVYPGAFRINRDSRDATGVVHHQEQTLIGESWSQGPLILSWDDVAQDLQSKHLGRNVVIHEIAHKLDMLNGYADGYPPLAPDMAVTAWSTTFNAAYQSLVLRLEHHHTIPIDPYAASSPAEFFAVASEYFFCAPAILQTHFADVYQQLQLYYRQNPLSRVQPTKPGHPKPSRTTRDE
ncbi:MAG: zinc-dependent peptidase [Methylococcales bacterium]|nr:zinc-dependent peptidase [Methylococcales bacterium]